MNKYFGPKINGWTLQASGNFFMDNVIHFHNVVLCLLFFILFLVSWLLITVLVDFGKPVLRYNLYLYLNSLVVKYSPKLDHCYLLFIIIIPFKFKEEYGSIALFYNMIIAQINNGSFFSRNNIFLTFLTVFLKNNLHKYGSFQYYINFLEHFNLDQCNPYIFYNKEQNNFYVNNRNVVCINSLSQFIYLLNIEYRYYFYADVTLEFLWTLFPSLILCVLAVPSFGLLYSIEKVAAPDLTVKVIGHQWYWEYQYSDYMLFNNVTNIKHNGNNYAVTFTPKGEDDYIIESYMLNDSDLPLGGLRLLEVDNKLMLPVNTSIRLLITSEDVLHAWAVPALGIKMDACPGRLNEIIINIRDIGSYFGQCSELCGWYHGFMPIAIQSLNPEDFRYWAISKFADVKIKKNVS